LLYHRSTSAINTKVETNNGNVTLYGKASNAAESNLATKLANDVNGVKGVKNQIRLSTSPQRIPQHVEVPPNIEAKRIVSRFSAVLSC